MISRWIRLDTTWSQSGWVAALEPEARLAWVELLCHVKAHGYAGSVKRLSPNVAARLWGLRVTAVTDMEAAATSDDALIIDEDEWIITGWSQRQSDPKAAERMRRYRERQQEDAELSTEADVTRNARNVTETTPTETETETSTSMVHKGTEDVFPAKPKQVKGQYQYPEPFERAWASYPSRIGPNPKVGAYGAFRARVASGADVEELVIAAGHYGRECRVKEKEGTEFVLQAATFYGPNEPWRDYVDPPKASGAVGVTQDFVEQEIERRKKAIAENEARRSA
jgi:hypothetical protein